jgi:predicted transcriptional regulator YheO
MADKCIELLIPLVEGIARAFGENCEVVLHDLSNPSKSILKIANGHITGRDIGVPLTDLGLQLYEQIKDGKKGPEGDLFVGYRTKTEQGRDLKSTTIFIRNSRGKLVGSLCINIDITSYLLTRNILDNLCKTADHEFEDQEKGSPEKFHQNLDTLIQDLLEGSIRKIGKPVIFMTREEKNQVVRDLKERGFFLIKGSLKKLTKAIGLSSPTIYKYMEDR